MSTTDQSINDILWTLDPRWIAWAFSLQPSLLAHALRETLFTRSFKPSLRNDALSWIQCYGEPITVLVMHFSSVTRSDHPKNIQCTVSWLIIEYHNAYLMSTVNHVSFLLHVSDAICLCMTTLRCVFVAVIALGHSKFIGRWNLHRPVVVTSLKTRAKTVLYA